MKEAKVRFYRPMSTAGGSVRSARVAGVLLALVISLLLVTSAHAQALGDRIRINGYFSFEYEQMFGHVGEGDPHGSFDADEFDLVLNFFPTDKVRVAADLTWEHGTATEDGRGNAAVEYAFGEYTINEMLRLRAGKMFTAFGIYNEIHTAKPAFLTVKEPLSTNKPDKFGADMRFYPRWGAGVAILGNGHLDTPAIDFDYDVQMTNGEQEATDPFEEDDNSFKAVTARVRFYIDKMEIGASFYSDRMNEYDDAGDQTGELIDLQSYGAHVRGRVGDLGYEVEYVEGFVDPTDGPCRFKDGLSAMVYYTIGGVFTPYFRWEYLDPDTSAANDIARQYIGGFNWMFAESTHLKVEVDTIQADEENPTFSESSTNYSELKAAFVIGF